MARPYSNDLRERVALSVASGRKCREVATLFQVSVASVVKWSQRYRATGTAAAGKMGGYRKPLLEPHRELVLERMAAKPDMTIRELVDELAAHGINTTPVTA
jgi:transposase